LGSFSGASGGGAAPKDRTPAVKGSVTSDAAAKTRADDQDKLAKQYAWEDSHAGGYQRIFPLDGPENAARMAKYAAMMDKSEQLFRAQLGGAGRDDASAATRGKVVVDVGGVTGAASKPAAAAAEPTTKPRAKAPLQKLSRPGLASPGTRRFVFSGF
jgi:hypothetical protein